MELDLINKCRVCLSNDQQMHCLFNEFDQGVTLRDILTSTTGFEVEKDDGLSPYVCENCTTIIVDFYNLKTIYEENENQIKTLLNNASSKEPEVSSTSPKQKADFITIKIENYESEDESSEEEVSLKTENVENTDVPVVEDDGNSKENYEYQEINTYTCPECGDCFLYKHDIQAHMLSKHDTNDINYDEIAELSLVKVKKDETLVNNCKMCNQSFDSDDAYKDHLETHKKNVCDICGVGFVKKSYLKDHQEIHCSEKRHVCTYCNKAFKRRTVLVKHKRIHTHPRQCICEICGKAFNDKGTLKTHIMLLHVKERNYMCLICGVKFPLKGTLEKHVRRHQNKEREFFCTQCPLGYRDKSSLDRHIYVKHSGQNIKSTCSDCGKQYTTLSNLFKHRRNCHNDMTQGPDRDENT